MSDGHASSAAPGSAPAAPAVGAMPVVRALLLLDADGKRIAVKYYTAEWCVVVCVCVCGLVGSKGAERGEQQGARVGNRAHQTRRCQNAASRAPTLHPRLPSRSTVHQQAEFEKAVFAKTARVNARGEGALFFGLD